MVQWRLHSYIMRDFYNPLYMCMTLNVNNTPVFRSIYAYDFNIIDEIVFLGF